MKKVWVWHQVEAEPHVDLATLLPIPPGNAGHHEVHLRHDGQIHLPSHAGRSTPGARGELLPGELSTSWGGRTPAQSQRVPKTQHGAGENTPQWG